MPSWKDEIADQLAALELEPTREAEIVEELMQHLDDRYHDLIARGISPAAALQTVLAELRERNELQRELRRIERSVHYEPVVAGVRSQRMIVDLW